MLFRSNFNNLPVLFFSNSHRLISPQTYANGSNNPFTYFGVFKIESAITNQINLFINNVASQDFSLCVSGPTANRGVGVFNSNLPIINSGVFDFDSHICAFRMGGSGQAGIWVDGVKYSGTWSSNVAYNTIGFPNNGTMRVAEFLGYSSFLADSEVIEISNQLNAKYAIY